MQMIPSSLGFLAPKSGKVWYMFQIQNDTIVLNLFGPVIWIGGFAKFDMCIIYVQNAKWNPAPAPWDFQPHKFEVDIHATSLRSESHVASQKAHTHDMPMSMMGILKMYVKYIVQCRYLGHKLHIYTTCILFN